MMMMPQLISVLLVDDDPIFREGLKTLLNFYNPNDQFELCVVGEAASVNQALKLASQQHPSLILLDLELPGTDGISALVKWREELFQGRVIVLSEHRQDEAVFRAMEAGARGYVFKDRLAQQLYDAIATVIKGEIYLGPAVATSFFRVFHFHAGRSLQGCQTIHLTAREREVLEWLIKGNSNEQIADRLCVTVATVKAHLTAIFQKLEVRSRTQAVVKALKVGLVSR